MGRSRETERCYFQSVGSPPWLGRGPWMASPQLSMFTEVAQMKVRDKIAETAVPTLGCGWHLRNPSCPSFTQSSLGTDGRQEGQLEEAHFRNLPQSQLGYAKPLWSELAASSLTWHPIRAPPPLPPSPLYLSTSLPNCILTTQHACLPCSSPRASGKTTAHTFLGV